MDKDLKMITIVLDANYYKVNIDKVVQEAVHMMDEEWTKLLKLMKRYKSIFDDNLGTWKVKPYNLPMREYVDPYHAQ